MADEQRVVRPVPATRSPEFKVIYTNGVNLAFTPWDINMIITQITEISNVELAMVSMSPQHAKALARLWVKTVEQYESLFGEIPDVSSKMEQISKASKLT